MEIINRKVKDLIPYDKNPRKNDEAVKYVKASREPLITAHDSLLAARL